jgi:hypothetical protein
VAIRVANDVLRFALELGALTAAAAFGWHAGGGVTRWLLAAAAPLAVALAWGIWMAPKSGSRVADPGRLALELLIFGGAAAALLWIGSTGLGAAFAAAAAVHIALTFLLHQR